MSEGTVNERVVGFVRAAMATRALSWAALAGATALWIYAAIDPAPLRHIAAGAYTAGVWLPLLLKGE